LRSTLTERLDSGIISRIQQFTMQNIPVATGAGLEPKLAATKMFAARPESRYTKPGGGDKRFGKPFAQRRDSDVAQRRDTPFAPRRDDNFAPRRKPGVEAQCPGGYSR